MRNQKIVTSASLVSVGALLLGVCFLLLPWVKGTELDGKDLLKAEEYLWLIPIAVVLALGWTSYIWHQGLVDKLSIFVGTSPALLALVAVGAFLVESVSKDAYDLDYGFWGALIATVIMLSGSGFSFTALKTVFRGSGSVPYAAPIIPMPSPQPPPAPPVLTKPAAPSRPAQQQAPRREPTQPIGAPAQPVGWLVARSGSRSGQSYGLKQGNNTVGRDSSRADIVLDDPTVSGEHARVRFEGGQFYLYDLASSNGTFVNGRRVQRQMLMDNDVVSFGEAELVFKKV